MRPLSPALLALREWTFLVHPFIKGYQKEIKVRATSREKAEARARERLETLATKPRSFQPPPGYTLELKSSEPVSVE